MDKKVINEEQFRKLVIEEAKKFISKEASTPVKEVVQEPKRKISFDKVESLINEIESMNKSISSLSINLDANLNSEEVIKESVKKPNRDLDVNNHNKNKNVLHVNEGEKDKWNRMLNYNVPSDDQR
jgi:hypothetical protein